MMKKLALLLLLGMAALVVMVLADGIWYANSGTLAIVTDSGGASVATVDSGRIDTPIQIYRFRGLVAKIKFNAPIVSSAVGAGWTDSDTLTVRLRTSMGDGQVKTLDSMRLAPPCSLFTRIPVAVATEDTLFWKDLYWTWKINDTLGDTVVTVNQTYYYEVIVKE